MKKILAKVGAFMHSDKGLAKLASGIDSLATGGLVSNITEDSSDNPLGSINLTRFGKKVLIPIILIIVGTIIYLKTGDDTVLNNVIESQ